MRVCGGGGRAWISEYSKLDPLNNTAAGPEVKHDPNVFRSRLKSEEHNKRARRREQLTLPQNLCRTKIQFKNNQHQNKNNQNQNKNNQNQNKNNQNQNKNNQNQRDANFMNCEQLRLRICRLFVFPQRPCSRRRSQN